MATLFSLVLSNPSKHPDLYRKFLRPKRSDVQSTVNAHVDVVVINCSLVCELLEIQRDTYFERGGRVMVSALSLGNSLWA